MTLLNEFDSLLVIQQCIEESCRLPTALTVSAIFDMHMNTARRRRQNAATVNLLSTSLSFADVFNTPMSYNFDKSWSSMRDR